MIANHSIISKIFTVKYNLKETKRLVVPILKLIANILRGNEEITNTMIRRKVICFLKKFLSNRNSNVKKELCYALSLITSGTIDQNYELLKYDLLSQIKDLCYDSSTLVRKEALYVFINSCKKLDIKLTCQLIKSGLLEIYKDNLSYLHEKELVYLSLEGIELILSVGNEININNPFSKFFSELGGIEAIENIISKLEDKVISNKCNKILDNFYINDEIKGMGYNQFLSQNCMKIH